MIAALLALASGATHAPPHVATTAHGLDPSAYRAAARPVDTSTVAFDADGLHVILRRNTANDVIAANLYLLGGTRQLTPATQGIEEFLLAASERGSRQFPGDAARLGLARLGSRLTLAPSVDFTLFGVTCIRATFDSTWAIFADQVVAPTLDSSDVELVRERLLAAVREEQTQPDALVEDLADSMEYAGHPYGFAPEGTAASVQSITLGQLRAYHASQMVTSRMLLVVVGNIDRATLEPAVAHTIGQLPHGSYTWTPPPAAPHLPGASLIRSAQLPTNYILGYYAGPAARDPDYQALRVASAVLSGRFFTEIRSKRNLTYDVDAPFLERAASSGGVYVTTTDPNATLQLMRQEIVRLQTELIETEGLERLVQQFITDYFLKNETNGDQATFLARAEIYQGDYRAADGFIDALRRVTPEDVRRVARRYMHDFRFVYLGNPDRLNRDLLDGF